MSEVLAHRIFLASPGDLEDERVVIRQVVDEFNARDAGMAYDVVGWERVRGTARRPQEQINELISESHFLVALFKSKWGSNPGSPWGFTSGTEEELFVSLLELGRSEQPMRDIWVAFIEAEDPEDRVAKLRKQISDNHALMYEAIASTIELKDKFAQRLEGWMNLTGKKEPRSIEMLPSSGKDVLGAQRRRIEGEQLVKLGDVEMGKERLKEASVLGGPGEKMAFARLLARQGKFEESLTEIDDAIGFFRDGGLNLQSSSAAEAYAAKAGVFRRSGNDVQAIMMLQQALQLMNGHEEPHDQAIRCRILDELGLARQRSDTSFDLAREAFEEALELRREAALEVDICQSLINLARLEVRLGNQQTAAEHANEALATLEQTHAKPALLANAHVLMAQIQLRQGEPGRGISNAKKARILNKQLDNRRGEAIALLLLAQCSSASGELEDAREYARTCLELNRAMDNGAGERRAQRTLDEIDAST